MRRRKGFRRPALRRSCRPKVLVFGSLPRRRSAASVIDSGDWAPRPSRAHATDLSAKDGGGRASGSSIVASASCRRTSSYPASLGRNLRAGPRHGRQVDWSSSRARTARRHAWSAQGSRPCRRCRTFLLLPDVRRNLFPRLQAVPNHSTVSDATCRMTICMAARCARNAARRQVWASDRSGAWPARGKYTAVNWTQRPVRQYCGRTSQRSRSAIPTAIH